MEYEVASSGIVKRTDDEGNESYIPIDEDNLDYQAYQAWTAEGNSAVPIPDTGPTAAQQKAAVDNASALRAKAKAYLALPAPTAAQTQKAVRALVMLAIAQLDDISGT